MTKLAAATVALLLFVCPAAFGQDAMRYGVKHLTVLAENENVRVLRYAPHKGDRTPMHSHPASVVYVLKGGQVKYTMPDGSTKISEFKTGQTLLRPPVTHADEALDGVEMIMTELKPQAGSRK
jgi:quercetin dioxygenase-like cupin family protein